MKKFGKLLTLRLSYKMHTLWRNYYKSLDNKEKSFFFKSQLQLKKCFFFQDCNIYSRVHTFSANKSVWQWMKPVIKNFVIHRIFITTMRHYVTLHNYLRVAKRTVKSNIMLDTNVLWTFLWRWNSMLSIKLGVLLTVREIWYYVQNKLVLNISRHWYLLVVVVDTLTSVEYFSSAPC